MTFIREFASMPAGHLCATESRSTPVSPGPPRSWTSVAALPRRQVAIAVLLIGTACGRDVADLDTGWKPPQVHVLGYVQGYASARVPWSDVALRGYRDCDSGEPVAGNNGTSGVSGSFVLGVYGGEREMVICLKVIADPPRMTRTPSSGSVVSK